MKITTKYDIGDRVEYTLQQKTVGGSAVEHSPSVGIIESISYDGKKVIYYLKSSYAGPVLEEYVSHKLKRE